MKMKSTERVPSELFLLLILAGVQFTHMVDFVIMMPLGPQFMREFKIGPQEFGAMVSAYTYSAAFFGFLGALFIDRFDRKRAMLGLYLGFILGTLFCALAPTHHWFIAARAMAGAFAGILGALIFAIIGDAIPEARRGAATGTVMSSFSLASIMGVPLGLWVAGKTSWHAPFVLLSGLSSLIWILGFFALPQLRGHLSEGRKPSRGFGDLWRTVKDPSHLFAFSLSIALNVSGFLVIPYLATFLVGNSKFPESSLPHLYMVGGLFTLAVARSIGKLSDRFGKGRVFQFFAFFSMLPVFMVTHFADVSIGAAIAMSTLFMISMSGRMIPAMTLITSSVTPQRRGSFMSVNSSLQQLAAGGAASIGGYVISQTASGEIAHFGTVGWMSMGCTALGVIFARRIRIVS